MSITSWLIARFWRLTSQKKDWSRMKLTIACLPEPLLGFGQNSEGLEPRRQLAKAGPADGGRFSEIRLGLVGLENDVAATRLWLRKLGHFLPAREANASRYR